MTRYETTFILDPGLDENKVKEEIDRVSQWIKDLGGEVVEVQRWGKRRLAYEINRKRDGIYTLMLYDGAGEMVKEIERRMRLNEAYMRVLSVLHVPPDQVQTEDESAAGEKGDARAEGKADAKAESKTDDKAADKADDKAKSTATAATASNEG